MRDKLDELRFLMYELTHSIGIKLEQIPDVIKRTILVGSLSVWVVVCVAVFLDSYNYEAQELPEEIYVPANTAKDTIDKARELDDAENYPEEFNLLATHLNNFSNMYTSDQLDYLEHRLTELLEYALPGDIEELYQSKDLKSEQSIYKFNGVVVSVDTDPLYGVTHTVSYDGTKSQSQLEVTGLSGVEIGASVSFYGVPVFTNSATPLKVEAFVAPNK